MAKVTKREQLVAIHLVLTTAGEVGLADFVGREVTMLDKRANAPRKLTTAQRENVTVKRDIVALIGDREAVRATEIAGELGFSVQKVTALLRQLVADGFVIRDSEGKVTTFRVAE